MMIHCECIEGCPFFNDKMKGKKSLIAIYMRLYCLEGYADCARYKVFKKLGKGNVPANLYPSMYTRAETILARDGHELVEQYEKHRVDIIVTDVNMPGMDGISAVKKINDPDNQDYRNTPVIIITAFTDHGLDEQLCEYGVREILLKPVADRELTASIEKHVALQPVSFEGNHN